MRTVIRMSTLGLLLTLPLSGCQTPCASTGWRFEVGRPATIQAPTTVEQTTGPLAIGGVGAGPVAGSIATNAPGRAMMLAAQQPYNPCEQGGYSGAPPRQPVLANLAPQGSCTMDDLCTRLERIETRLQQKEALPMPKGDK